MKTSYTKPLLPLRDIVIFPSMVVPLFVGREKSIKALQDVMKSDKSIVLVTQKNSEIDDPNEKDLYGYGCLSKVLQLLKLPDGTVKVLVEGERRVKILKYENALPWSIVAGVRRGVIGGNGVVGLEINLDTEDRYYLEPFGLTSSVKP